jgi:hypothetical protein
MEECDNEYLDAQHSICCANISTQVDLYKKPIKVHTLNKKTSFINKIPALHGHTILSGKLSPTTKPITKILGIKMTIP